MQQYADIYLLQSLMLIKIQLDATVCRYLFIAKFNVNKNPTRCNSMQIFIYCKV